MMGARRAGTWRPGGEGAGVRRGATTVRVTAGEHGRRRGSIVESLLREVFEGRLRAGQRVIVREIAARYGVSHTPVREALSTLAGLGVVDLLPNRGAVVLSVTDRDIRDVCRVRGLLECEAVRCACGRLDPEALALLSDDLRRLAAQPAGGAEYLESIRRVDNRLHDLVASGCGNGFLAQELGRLKLLFRAYRDTSWRCHEARNDLERVAEECHEHLAIVRALQLGRAQEAARAMKRHIEAGARYWSRAVTGGEPPVPVAALGAASDLIGTELGGYG